MPNNGRTTNVISRPMIRIDHVDKVFTTVANERIQALSEISMDIADGEFITIVGPSGCGKSTLLKILAGLQSATSGTVELDGTRVSGPRRDIGIMFQNPILFPWRTVLQNVLLPAEVQGRNITEARARAKSLLAMVGLGEFEKKYPNELSGGMQQRAAITRALLNDPHILLMDEPFGALDAMTREQMNLELQRIWGESRKTVVLITHSIAEAVFLADRVLVLSARPGRIARIIDVPIPRPRAMGVLSSPEFARLCGEVRQLLYGTDSAADVTASSGSLS
ncbi:NitT/TauT family transport system ATP-binding protein [Nitrobacteraceae bacterium AZCC 2161]